MDSSPFFTPYQVRAFAGAALMLAVLLCHYERYPTAGEVPADGHQTVDPETIVALMLFFVLLSHRRSPNDANQSYSQRQLAATHQSLEEASFRVFPQEEPRFPDNFFRHLNRQRSPVAGGLIAEATTKTDEYLSSAGQPFQTAVRRLVLTAAETGQDILYHEAFPAAFSARVVQQRLYGVVPYLTEYCHRAEIQQAPDFTYLADVLEDAALQQPEQAVPLRRGVQWLQAQAQAAATAQLTPLKLRWGGKTRELIEIGYALVEANYLTSEGASQSRDQLVTEFAWRLGKSVPNPRYRLTKRRKSEATSAHPALDKVLAAYAAADFWLDGSPAGGVSIRSPELPSDNRPTPVAAERPLRTARRAAFSSTPQIPGIPFGPGGIPNADFWPELCAHIRTVMEEVLQSPPALAAPARDPEELLTVPQAAALMAVCRQTIHDWVRRGLLPSHKMGRRTYIRRTELLASPRRQERSRKTADRPRTPGRPPANRPVR